MKDVTTTDGHKVTVSGRLEITDVGALVSYVGDEVEVAFAPRTWKFVAAQDAQITWEPAPPTPPSTVTGSFA